MLSSISMPAPVPLQMSNLPPICERGPTGTCVFIDAERWIQGRSWSAAQKGTTESSDNLRLHGNNLISQQNRDAKHLNSRVDPATLQEIGTALSRPCFDTSTSIAGGSVSQTLSRQSDNVRCQAGLLLALVHDGRLKGSEH